MKTVLVIFRIERKYIIVSPELESYNLVDRYNNTVFVGNYVDCITYANKSNAYWFFAKDTIHSTVSDMADFIIDHLVKQIDRNFAVEDDDDNYEIDGPLESDFSHGGMVEEP